MRPLVTALLVAARPQAAVVVVDRIEGDWAVVEWPGGETTDLPLRALPSGVGEGDRLAVATFPALSPPPVDAETRDDTTLRAADGGPTSPVACGGHPTQAATRGRFARRTR